MRTRMILGIAAFVAAAACSNDPEPLLVGDGNEPQAELAQLDSAAAEWDKAEAATQPPPVEQPATVEQPPQPRPPASAAAKKSKPAPPASTPAPAAKDSVEVEAADTTSEPATPVEIVTATESDTNSEATADSAPPEPAESSQPEPAESSPAPAPPPVPQPAADTIATGAPAAPPAKAADGRGVVEAGTQIHVALNDSINSRKDSVGKVVTARVMQHVTDGAGKIFIPAGAVVQLTVTRLEPAKSRSAADGKLELRVDGVRAGHEVRPINAEVQEVPRELRGRGVTGSEVAKVGAGTAAGAVAGRVIGGNTRGAVIGGAVGAAAGAAVAAQTADRDIVVSPRTPIVLVLNGPLVAARSY